MMKTSVFKAGTLALVLSAGLSLNAWSADAVQVTPSTTGSTELTNLGEPDNATGAAPDASAASQADTASAEAQAASASTAAKKPGARPAQEEAGTSFSKVGMPGTITSEELNTQGSPAKYRELVLSKAVAARHENPVASRRYLAVDRATYQARILGQ
jgi:hypothetical protein